LTSSAFTLTASAISRGAAIVISNQSRRDSPALNRFPASTMGDSSRFSSDTFRNFRPNRCA
jgi:hypothetical protein